MTTVEVKLQNPYNVLIGHGLLDRLGKEVINVCRANKVLVLTDSNVEQLYLERALKSLEIVGLEPYVFVVDAGEQSKTATTYLDVITCLGGSKFKRTDAVVALGGGVVGDLAGFAAATYMRGIDVVQVPTSLLAMIDSSVGGKTGVNLAFGKNLLGAFHQPRLVLADIGVLSTLPQAEWKNGLGEGIKYACLAGGRISEILAEGIDNSNLEEFVALSVSYKAAVVEKDEKEGRLRKLLNFGHTVGHAIELHSGYKISHGVAVACGIRRMVSAAYAHGEITAEQLGDVIALIEKNDIPTNFELGDIASAILMDKKTEGKGYISFVGFQGQGDCYIKNVTIDEFVEYIKA